MSMNNAAIRSVVRDCIERLKHMKRECGGDVNEGDDGPVSTGDPFRDECLEFTRLAKAVRAAIQERNELQQKGQNHARQLHNKDTNVHTEVARLNHDIQGHFKDMRKHKMAAISLSTETEKKLNRARAKLEENKKKESKVAKYTGQIEDFKKVWEEEQRTLLNCGKILDTLEKCNTDRENASEVGINPEKNQASNEPRLRQRLTSRMKEIERKQRREDRRKAQEAGEGGDKIIPTDDEDPDEEMRNINPGAGGKKVAFNDDPDIAKQRDKIAALQQQEDQMLTELLGVLTKIGEKAQRINDEFKLQDDIMTKTEGNVDKVTQDLKTVNRGLNKVMRDQKPANCFLNICMLFLLLSIVGFFLYRFNIV